MTPHHWIADAGRLITFAADGSLLVTGQHPEKLSRYVGPGRRPATSTTSP